MSTDTSGATVNPHAEKPQGCPHAFLWVWWPLGPQNIPSWTDYVKCSRCGEIRMNKSSDQSTIKPGVIHDPVQHSD